MIYQPNLQQGGRFVDPAGDPLIGAGWRRIPARVVVLCVVPDYVVRFGGCCRIGRFSPYILGQPLHIIFRDFGVF
jgi:hypothetical protein